MSFEAGVHNGSRPVVVLSANTAWFITNFCGGLVRELRKAGYRPVAIAPQDSAATAALGQLDLEHYHVHIDRSGANPVADLRLLREYRDLLTKLRPAAYFGFTIKPNIYGSIAARRLGIPSIATVSGLGTAFMRRGALQSIVTRLYRFGFRNAAAVFFQNNEDCSLFVRHGLVRPEQGRVVPGLGVDLVYFSKTPLPDGPPTFLLIARLLRDKGVIEYIEAARLVRSSMPKSRFQLLGPVDHGNRTAIAETELDGWVKEGVVEYLGARDDVRPAITAANAVVLPSYREGMPRALLEGAAMGRPLVATDVPGCRDVVVDGQTGYLCAPRDPVSLASAMRRLAELPAKERAAMGEAARRWIQERFSDTLVVRAYLDALGSAQAAQPGTR